MGHLLNIHYDEIVHDHTFDEALIVLKTVLEHLRIAGLKHKA